jgi:hypothetical protein
MSEIVYSSKNSLECKKLEDVINVFNKNYSIEPPNAQIDVSWESLSQRVNITPVSGTKIFSVKRNLADSSGRLRNSSPESVSLDLGDNTYHIKFNPIDKND